MGDGVSLRRSFEGIFLFDTFFKTVFLGDAAVIRMENDKSVPFERVLGIVSSIYDVTNSTCEVVTLIGCDVDPQEITKALRRLIDFP